MLASESNWSAITESISSRVAAGAEISMPFSSCEKLISPPVSADAPTIFAGIAGNMSFSVGQF